MFVLSPSYHSRIKAPTDCGSDERWRISNVVETFSLDEISHVGREILIMSLNIVFQYQAAQRTSGLIWNASTEAQRSWLKLQQVERVLRQTARQLDDEEGTSTFRFEACEDEDQIVVEIRKLIKLLQFLQVLSRSSNMCLPAPSLSLT